MTHGLNLKNLETLNISFIKIKKEIIVTLNKPNIIKVILMYGVLHLKKYNIPNQITPLEILRCKKEPLYQFQKRVHLILQMLTKDMISLG
jgi:hypothetical protein